MKSIGRESGIISVVIPAYKVSRHLGGLLERIGDEITNIIVVDDCCPEKSGKIAQEFSKKDNRISVIFHDQNMGVGGAVKSGYTKALALGSDIVVKLDGDGQMNPDYIDELVHPLIIGIANYTKGNRFYDIEAITQMPKIRIFGNLALSFMSKLSTGYWTMFDPNNGFTAIDSRTLKKLPLEKIDNRYFFESDMLFRLNLTRAWVEDVPLPAIYGKEESSLSITRSLFEFLYKHHRNFVKRIGYSYFLREFSIASIQLVFGFGLLLFGTIMGITNSIISSINQVATPTGTLVLIAMSILSGLQLLIAFFSYDIQVSPSGRFSSNR